MDWRGQGLGPCDIAKLCKISEKTVFKYLSLIAEENDVKREDLLLQPHHFTEETKAAMIAAAKKPRKKKSKTAAQPIGVDKPEKHEFDKLQSEVKTVMETETNEAVALESQVLAKFIEPDFDHLEEFDFGEKLSKYAKLGEEIETYAEKAVQSTKDRLRILTTNWKVMIS